MASYYVDVAVGNDGNAGTSEGAGNAWASLAKARATYGSGDKIWVKASGDYVAQDGANDCIMLISTVLGSLGATVVLEGYTTTPGDGGEVTLDAQSTLTNCIKSTTPGSKYLVFKNFRTTNATDVGVAANTSDYVRFECGGTDNNGGVGADLSNFCIYYRYQSYNNAAGLNTDINGMMIACRVFSNTDNGTVMHNGVWIYNELYDNGGAAMYSTNNEFTIKAGNTVDGDLDATSIGLYQVGAVAWMVAINNIIMQCDSGMESTVSLGAWGLVDHNLMVSNTTDYTNVVAGSNDIDSTTDPFTNSATRDYTLVADGEAVGAGIDAGGIGAGMDTGAIQYAGVAGGGTTRMLVDPGWGGGFPG